VPACANWNSSLS